MDITKSSVRMFLSDTSSSVLRFLGFIYLARIAGAADLGIFFLFQSLLAISSIIADLGIRRSVEKRVSEDSEPHSMFTAGLFGKSFALAGMSTIILTFGTTINSYVGEQVALLLVLGIISQEVFRFSESVLRGELRVVRTANIKFIYHVVWILGGILLYQNNFGIKSMMYSLILGYTLLAIYSFKISSTGINIPNKSHFQSIFSFSKYNFVSRLGGQFYNWVDVAIIGFFMTQADVGAYEIAWKITLFALLVSKAIGTSIFPQISKLDSENNIDKVQSILSGSIVPPLALTIPIFVGTTLLSESILSIVYSEEFAIASVALIVLSAEKIFQGVHAIIGRTLLAINKPNLAARATLISLLFNIILNIVLIYNFGLLGAALATALASLINIGLHWKYLTEYLQIPIPTHEISHICLSSVVMGVAVWGLKQALELNSIIVLGSIILSGGGVYIIALLTSKDIRNQAIRLTKSFSGDVS